MEKLVHQIHYNNNLWKVSEEAGEKKAAKFFKGRKCRLQNQLLSGYPEQSYLDRDREGLSEGGKDMYVIRLNQGGDACHIPLIDIDEEIRNSLGLK
jgi:hypothetical protein